MLEHLRAFLNRVFQLFVLTHFLHTNQHHFARECYAFIRCTAPFNLTGNPALSVPCGLTEPGLPVGLQLIAPPFADGRLVSLARLFEQARGSFPRPPRGLT